MNNGLSVIILSRNESDNLKKCLGCLRKYSNGYVKNIIVADNDSDDRTSELIRENEDVVFYEIKDEVIPWGRVLNMIIDELNIDSDILILSARTMITPNCISKLLSMTDKCCAIVGTANYTNDVLMKPIREISDYNDALNYAYETENIRDFNNVMQLYPAATLFQSEVFEKIGKFDERLFSISSVYTDYSLRMLEGGIEIFVNRGAFIYEVNTEVEYKNEIDSDSRILKSKYGMNYFNLHSNHNIIEILSAEISKRNVEELRILEVGCDLGATLFAIKQKFSYAKLYGIELNEAAANIAGHSVKVIVANIEEENLNYENGYFDYIIFGDVLEHLHNPESTLRYIKKYLKNDGKIIASIPNLMHISVMKELLKGNFTYTDDGLLDKTHIHMFTYREIVKMLERAGLNNYEFYTIGGLLDNREEEIVNALLTIEPEAEYFMYSTFQYLVIAGK